MADNTYFAEINEHTLEQATDVLTRSFLDLNDIWKKFKPTYEQIYPIMRGKILPSMKAGWSLALMREKQVIGVCIQYEMLDYLQMPNMPSDLELFKILGNAGKTLQQKLDFSELKRGDAIYGLFGVIDPNEASKGHSLKFWWNSFTIGKIAGWKYYYSRISSQVSLKMLVQLGAEILAEATVEGTEGKEKVWMIRIDLTKPFPTYNMLAAMSKRKNKPEAKL